MKIVSFSNTPMLTFWSIPVQALVPWISRIKHSLAHTAELPPPHCNSKPPRATAGSCNRTASNDSNFNLGQQVPFVLPSSHPLLASSKISLRVVRESDSAIRPDCAGRMVISGRMADVCAELDRMALRAAAPDS